MCSLIVLRGLHASHPLVVAANRDERTDRRASPPGLYEGARRRLLSPRDRVAGGTWIAVDDRGRLAALTNVHGQPPVIDAPSRGHLPHLVLDHDDLGEGLAAVRERVAEHAHAAFQLVVADPSRVVVLRHVGSELRQVEWDEPVLAVSNEHAPGQLALRGLQPALAPGLSVSQRLDALAHVLRDRGGGGHHALLKLGEHYGTVSSSLVAVPRRDPAELVWRYAAGPPDRTPYRDYGNLGRHLRAAP